MARIYIRTPLAERFWSKVEKTTTGCWIWTGSRNHKGYGQLRLPGRTGRLAFAHRISYELHIGKIPDGLLVCHHCDNPPCVRPDHLFSGTFMDNGRDSGSKGRAALQRYPELVSRGETHPMAKLTAADVAEIRDLYSRRELTQVELGRRFGVRQTMISRIVNRENWRDA